jgi:hypothetical protein
MKTIEITLACENVRSGMPFVAILVDTTMQRRFTASSSHDSKDSWARAWEALGWVLDEYVAVKFYNLGPTIARRGTDRPGSRLEPERLTGVQLVYESPRDVAPTPATVKQSAASRRSTVKRKRNNAG